MTRPHRLVVLLSLLSMLAGVAGCQAPAANFVPWWRGIPARLTTASSLEAEMWRRQHGHPGQSQPLPSRDFIGPLGVPGEIVSAPEPLVDDSAQDRSEPEKWDPKVPAAETPDAPKAPDASKSDDAGEPNEVEESRANDEEQSGSEKKPADAK